MWSFLRTGKFPVPFTSQSRSGVFVSRAQPLLGLRSGRALWKNSVNRRAVFSPSAGHQRRSWIGESGCSPGDLQDQSLGARVSVQKLSFLLLLVPWCFSISGSSSTVKEQEISVLRKTGQAEVPACARCSCSLMSSEMRRRKVLAGGYGAEAKSPRRWKRCGLERWWSTMTWVHFLREAARRVVLFPAALWRLLWSAGTGSPAPCNERTSKCAWKTWRNAEFQLIRKKHLSSGTGFSAFKRFVEVFFYLENISWLDILLHKIIIMQINP